MRILFNVEPLLSPPLTGVGHYARHILSGLMDPAAGLDVVTLAGGRPVMLAGLADVPPAVAPPTVRPIRRMIGSIPGARGAYAMLHRARTGITGTMLRGDVYHDPNHLLRPMGCPGVVTMHDLSILHYPQFHPPERVEAMSDAMQAAARQAERIITGSAFIARDIAMTLGVGADRVRVVPYGVGAEFGPLGAAADDVLGSYGLRRGGYVLAVGTREPRKNLERLLEAFLSLPAALRSARPLILVGPPGWQATRIEARLDAAERSGQVRRLGYVPDDHRAPLYSGAACFAYPSLYEGFGLPPLEAAACGCPVLTSLDSPMQEVLGAVATLVDPLEVASIAAGLRSVLEDGERAAAARLAGPVRAARFTWGASVAGTISVYREVAR